MEKNNGRERKDLKNGYIIEQLYKHYPPMQRTYTEKKKEEKKKRRGDDEKARRNFFFFLDDYLLNMIENNSLAITQKRIRERYEFGDYFRKRLEIIFEVTRYDKNKKKSREYILRETSKHIIYELLKVIVQKNKTDELNNIYEVSEHTTDKEYYSIPFNESKLYHKDLFEIEAYTIDKNLSNNTDLLILGKKELFLKMEKANIYLPDKIFVKEIYNYSKIKYENLKKTDKKFPFYTFTKSRKKIKQTQSTADLKKYISTNIKINEESIEKLIKEYLEDVVNDRYLYIFGLINLLRHYKKGTNSILYEEKKFRLYSSKRLNFGVNFQSIKSNLRKIIFQGQYDYDINAGAPTLLYQFIKQKYTSENIELQYLESYIKNRKILRKRCAEILAEKNKSKDTKEFEKQTKETFTALLYGSNVLSPKSKLSMNYSNRKYLYDNFDEFRYLVEDVKLLFKYYKEYIEKLKKESIKEDFIEIEKGIFIETKKNDNGKIVNKKENSIISEIYFYLESKILKLVYENYKEDISLLIHDGFVCRKYLELEELQNLVKEKLGYEVKYSRDLL